MKAVLSEIKASVESYKSIMVAEAAVGLQMIAAGTITLQSLVTRMKEGDDVFELLKTDPEVRY